MKMINNNLIIKINKMTMLILKLTMNKLNMMKILKNKRSITK